MKKISSYLLLTGLILSFTGAYPQYPAGFNCPKGIFIMIDSTWHKNSTVVIQRSDNSGSFKILGNIAVPSNELDFASMVTLAGKDFPVSASMDDKITQQWWDGLNGKPVMPVFMMSPAGVIAAGAGYYDKTAVRGMHYKYRVIVTTGDGTTLKDGTTGDVIFGEPEVLAHPRFIKASEDEKFITLTWGYIPKKMPSGMKLFRLGEGEKEYKEIGFAGGARAKGDSVFLMAKDTLVKPMMIYKYILKASDWFGNPYPVSDTALARSYSVYSAPVIRMFHTRPVPGQHAIRLSWPKISGQGLRGIILFRGKSYGGNFNHLATLNPSDTSYTDIVPLANENYWYFAIVANRFGYGLPSTRVFDLVTLSSNPLQPAPPVLKPTGKGVEVSWNYQGGIIKGYYLYRGEGYRGELKQLSGIIKPARSVDYTDTAVIPGNAYRYAIAALGEGNGLSPVSEAVSLMVPANGKITVPFNLRYRLAETQIMLFWENLLLNDGLVKGYVVYRKITGQNAFEKLTPVPLSSLTNSFTDSITFRGKTVEYAVSSIDPGGIESARSAPLRIEVSAPERIQVGGLSLINDGGNIVINWSVVIDPDIIGFRVFRFSETSEPVLINTNHANEYTTTDHSPMKGNKLNSYFVKAVYMDGTESEAGEIASIRVP